MIELVPLARQFRSMKTDILGGIAELIDSGSYIMGRHVKRLEEKASEYVGVDHAIGVANGTDALVLALEAFGIGPGDEVITTPYTFFATAEAISRVGAVPVFADIDPATYNLDPERVEASITPATKAIIPVHLFGLPADMDAIMDISRRHGLLVIEDACQAFGAEYRGRKAGSIGHAACFSFFPTKNLGTMGDGGLIVTSDAKAADRLRRLRQHGSVRKYVHAEIGYNSRLDELHAMVLLLSLEKIDEWNEERRRLAERYRKALAAISGLHVASPPPESKSIYHLFVVESDRRQALMERLTARSIQSGIYYPQPLHLQEAYARLGYAAGSMPVAERMSERMFAIPMSPFLSESEQDEVVSALANAPEDGGR